MFPLSSETEDQSPQPAPLSGSSGTATLGGCPSTAPEPDTHSPQPRAGGHWTVKGTRSPAFLVLIDKKVTERACRGAEGEWGHGVVQLKGFSHWVHFPGRPWLGPWSLSHPGHTHPASPQTTEVTAA